MFPVTLLNLLLAVPGLCSAAQPQANDVSFCVFGAKGGAINGVVKGFSLDGFAAAAAGAEGPVPIIDDGSVSEEARTKTRVLLSEMLARSPVDLRARLGRSPVFFVIIPQHKKLTDLVQFDSLRGVKLPDGRIWDDVRGVALVSQPGGAVAVAAGEENLLSGSADGYPKGYVFAHEFAHAIHAHGLSPASAGVVERLYQDRVRRGLAFPSPYAAGDEWEYFAVSSTAFFRLRMDGGPNGDKDWEWVRAEDAALYTLLEGSFGASRPLWSNSVAAAARRLALSAVESGLNLLGQGALSF